MKSPIPRPLAGARPYAVMTARLFQALVLLLFAATAWAADIRSLHNEITSFFPQADRIGELSGSPPAAPVYKGEELLGYALLSSDIVRIPAYSGKPINTLIAVDLRGVIAGVRIIAHEEPILLAGVSEQQLHAFTAQYRSRSAHERIAVGAEQGPAVDGISGATITVMVENATIMRAAREVAESRGLKPGAAAPKPSRIDPRAIASSPAMPRAGGAAAPPVNPRVESPIALAADATAPADPPLWISVWRERAFAIGVLSVGLIVLAFILVFQDLLVRRPKLLLYVRDGYLFFTLAFIGWYGLAQLSVVNVLTFVHAVTAGFRWDSFLLEPMMFILWSFVAVTLLLWGRGVYCGWLCPYGAAQELVQQVARRFNIRQWEFPDAVHERLWALKYIILLVLFGVSLQSLAQAERLAEVEPFKTAIVLRFSREWGYVLFAAGMILVSAVNRKFYCKYLCPLGAALAISARFRIFDWLRRRKECGRPCQICANECEVRAINAVGQINANECHYCLDCQVTYYNDHKCPPMVDRRKRREQSVRAREVLHCMECDLGRAGVAGCADQACSRNRSV